MKKKSRIYRLLGVAAVVVLAVCGMVMIIPQLGNVVSKPDDGLTSQEATEAAIIRVSTVILSIPPTL